MTTTERREMSWTERQERNDDYEATRWPHKPPTECPNCKAPVWIEGQAAGDPTGKRITYECGDSLTVAMGRIWMQDGSASFPHGVGCRLAKARLDRIAEGARLASAVEAMFAGECGREQVERMALAFLRGGSK